MQRKLGNFEKLIWQAGYVNSFNFVVIAQIKGSISPKTLRKALDMAQPSYPMLNVNVRRIDNDLFFSSIKAEIPLISKQVKSSDDWINEINKELNLPFDNESDPLVRALYLTGEDANRIVVTFNHIIADAISGIHFLYQLMWLSDRLLSGRTNVEIKSFEFLPSVEDLQTSIKNYNNFSENLIKIENNVSNGNYNTKLSTSILSYQLPENDTNKIIETSNSNDVSVHSYICSALSAALFETKANILDKLICLSPINMRPYLSKGIDADEMGYLLSRVDSRVLNKQSIIENAKLINDQISQFIELDMHKEILHSMRDIYELYFASGELHKKIQFDAPGLLVSNVGRLNFDSKLKNIVIENLHFGLACQGILGNKNSMAATITTFNTRMNINFHYIEPWTTKDEAIYYAGLSLKKLLSN